MKIASFDLTKKKKKKKKVQPEDKADESVDNLADQTENFTSMCTFKRDASFPSFGFCIYVYIDNWIIICS